MVALITNSEVLQVLKDRGADGKSGGRAQGSEKLVRESLARLPGSAKIMPDGQL